MIKKVFNILYVCLIVMFIISYFKIRELPEIYDINFSLYNQPIQTDTDKNEFSFLYRKKEYIVEPMADYELWGLVVSKNNINTWYNYYHDKNTVNLKDICVVWGKNIKNEIYLDNNISFSSGEFTCFVRQKSKSTKEFYFNNLSNNHLLSKDVEIQDLIRKVNIGDQIYLKGSLVKYKEVNQSNFRGTSLTREDHGNGACETVHVDEFTILKKNKEFWHHINKLSKKIFFSIIIIQLLIFVINTHKKNINVYHRIKE
jgi:hypothetical protein